jgi:two-component system nitrogen regulation sensor histidine kinase NtrY
MTERLSEQTDALVGANALLDRRRALTEAVLAGVSAGVIAVNHDHSVRLLNQSARMLLRLGDGPLASRPLVKLSPELADMLTNGDHDGIKSIVAGEEERTLAVKIIDDEGGHVLTFDDITTQINDQRRAAWADVARRIAHEIKNPLTPIQLAAERLQRRFAKEIGEEGRGTYDKLTETIIRQVGDLRRMVDEFSSFARIPKPVFRRENLVDIARQAIFLHEVAHAEIRFMLETESPLIDLVCDRRQLSQALINIIKNGVEAIEEKTTRAKSEKIVVRLLKPDDAHIEISVADTGQGLPQDRGRLAEPYVTTRERGSGLGLAIVQKIIEDHGGTISRTDNAKGGCIVTILLDRAALEQMTEDHITMKDI